MNPDFISPGRLLSNIKNLLKFGFLCRHFWDICIVSVEKTEKLKPSSGAILDKFNKYNNFVKVFYKCNSSKLPKSEKILVTMSNGKCQKELFWTITINKCFFQMKYLDKIQSFFFFFFQYQICPDVKKQIFIAGASVTKNYQNLNKNVKMPKKWPQSDNLPYKT